VTDQKDRFTDIIKEATKDLSLNEHYEFLKTVVHEEFTDIVKTDKFRNYLRAVLWAEIREKIISTSVLSMLSERTQRKIYDRTIGSLFKLPKNSKVSGVQGENVPDQDDE
jgi:hypothetical protein